MILSAEMQWEESWIQNKKGLGPNMWERDKNHLNTVSSPSPYPQCWCDRRCREAGGWRQELSPVLVGTHSLDQLQELAAPFAFPLQRRADPINRRTVTMAAPLSAPRCLHSLLKSLPVKLLGTNRNSDCCWQIQHHRLHLVASHSWL